MDIESEKSLKTVVVSELTAKKVKSGSLEVFATPSMIALIEQTACEICEKYLDEGQTTVGTKICVEHLAASVIGSEIVAKVKAIAIDGRKISFSAEVYDNAGLIGKGSHERFVVDEERFMSKARTRLEEAK